LEYSVITLSAESFGGEAQAGGQKGRGVLLKESSNFNQK